MSERGVNVARLESDPPPARRVQVLERAHVVKPVGQFDDDHPRVTRHREQQFPVRLHLTLGEGSDLHPGDLGQAVHDHGDLAAELALDLLHRRAAVLDHVVQERGGDAHRIPVDLSQNGGDLDAVRDVVLARAALLALVLIARVLESQGE